MGLIRVSKTAHLRKASDLAAFLHARWVSIILVAKVFILKNEAREFIEFIGKFSIGVCHGGLLSIWTCRRGIGSVFSLGRNDYFTRRISQL